MSQSSAVSLDVDKISDAARCSEISYLSRVRRLRRPLCGVGDLDEREHPELKLPSKDFDLPLVRLGAYAVHGFLISDLLITRSIAPFKENISIPIIPCDNRGNHR